MRNVFQVLLGLTALFGLGIGLAFGGGVLYGRNTASEAPTPQAASATGGGAGGAGAAGLGGAAGGQAGGTQASGGAQGAQARGSVAAGTVEKIDGNTITLRTQQGATTVTFTGDTEVRQTVAAQAADIRAGQTLTVTGQPGADGSLQARSITISPPGTAGGQQGAQTGQGTRGQNPPPGATATPTPDR